MPTISGPLSVVTEAAAVVTSVWVQAPALRTHGAGAILPQRAPATLTGSTVSFPCAPGPAVLIWQVGGSEDQVPILVDDVESQTLAEVVSAALLAEGRTQDELAALVQQVLDGAAAAEDAATSAAGSASSAASSATAAAQSAVNAANSEWVAGEHKGAAEAASGAAASSASAAATSAGAAASSESAAATSAGEAAASAGAASDAADRAENVVDTVQWQGDQLSVMGEVSPPLTGPEGPQGPAGDGTGDVLWSELNPVLDGKAPESHDHTASEISDSTSTGRSVLTASSQAAARQAIGAGTSNLTLGTTSSTAARGNHTHSQYAESSRVTALENDLSMTNESLQLFADYVSDELGAVSSRATALENSQPIIVSSLPASPLPGRIYFVTG